MSVGGLRLDMQRIGIDCDWGETHRQGDSCRRQKKRYPSRIHR
jgi:hypothetical protein